MMKQRIRRIVGVCLMLGLLLAVGCTTESGRQALSPNNSAPEPTQQAQVITMPTEEPISNEQKEAIAAVLQRATFLEGTTVNGVAIGGMTLSEANSALWDTMNAVQSSHTVNVQDGEEVYAFSGAQIKTETNLEAVLNEAFNLLRTDIGYEELMAEVERIAKDGAAFDVTVTFEPNSLQAAIDAYAETHDIAPTDAGVGYDAESNAIAYTDDVPGRLVDREGMAAALNSAHNDDTIELLSIEQPAEVTRADVEGKYVLRGTMQTEYKKNSSTSARRKNIEKGCKMITGTILKPGEEFSTNGKLGVRNKANGWYKAGAYEAGAVVEQYGGGVCQLSSTLYNAAVKADMEITDRRNHTMTVKYVHEGLDATINSTGNIIDFKFKNSSKSDIIIIGTTDGKYLTFDIYGIPISEDSNGEYDRINIPTPKKTKTIKPKGDSEYIVDEDLKPGTKVKEVGRRNGSIWKSVKEYYLGDTLVKSEDLATSTYLAFNGVYRIGPEKEAATESPKSGQTSEATPTASASSGATEQNTPAPTSDSGSGSDNSGNTDSSRSSGSTDSGSSDSGSNGNSGSTDSGSSGSGGSGSSGSTDSGSSSGESGSGSSGSSGESGSGSEGGEG